MEFSTFKHVRTEQLWHSYLPSTFSLFPLSHFQFHACLEVLPLSIFPFLALFWSPDLADGINSPPNHRSPLSYSSHSLTFLRPVLWLNFYSVWEWVIISWWIFIGTLNLYVHAFNHQSFHFTKLVSFLQYFQFLNHISLSNFVTSFFSCWECCVGLLSHIITLIALLISQAKCYNSSPNKPHTSCLLQFIYHCSLRHFVTSFFPIKSAVWAYYHTLSLTLPLHFLS